MMEMLEMVTDHGFSYPRIGSIEDCCRIVPDSILGWPKLIQGNCGEGLKRNCSEYIRSVPDGVPSGYDNSIDDQRRGCSKLIQVNNSSVWDLPSPDSVLTFDAVRVVL